jgi:hypothetical protein
MMLWSAHPIFFKQRTMGSFPFTFLSVPCCSAPLPVPTTVPCRLATATRCQEQLRACGGGSRRAWWPCCGGARVWVRSLSPTPTRHPSFRGVVLRSVVTPCPPSRNGRGSAALLQRTGAQQPLEEVVWRNAPEFPEGQITTTVVRPALVRGVVLVPSAWLCAQVGWQVARCRIGGHLRRPPPRAHGGWWSGLLCRAGRRLTRWDSVLAGGLSEAESMSRRRRC